jgi:3-oxoadipate enol-lactonase
MAIVQSDGAHIYWHSLGRGEPLVLIMGLGCSSAMWFRLAPLLARRYRVIMLDNRGVGRTEVDHFVVHRVSTMASDVVAVLAAAGEANAHVLGLSMGGMIAQQLALDHPQCVRSLMLAATNCGGPHAVLAEREVWRLMFSKTSMDPNEALAAMQPYTYAKATPQSRVDEDSVVRLAAYPSTRGYQAQRRPADPAHQRPQPHALDTQRPPGGAGKRQPLDPQRPTRGRGPDGAQIHHRSQGTLEP